VKRPHPFFALLALVSFSSGGEVFHDGPSKETVDWVVTWKTNGTIAFEPGPNGLRLVAAGGVSGYGARQFAVEAKDRGRYYTVSFAGRTSLDEGSAEAYLIARDEKGRTALFQGLGPLGPRPVAYRDIMRLSENVARFEVGLRFKNAKGEALVTSLRIETFEAPKELPAASLPKGPTYWAATGIDRTYGLPEFEPRRRDTALKLFACAGVLATRGGLRWESAEAEAGKTNYGPFIDKLDSFARYGIRVPIVCLGGTPIWASGKDPLLEIPEAERKKLGPFKVSNSYWAPKRWEDWERFVEGAVRAARGRVDAWEIINEPDLPSEGFMGTYEEYREYLKRAYLAAKRADGKARVFTGAFVKGDWLMRLYAEGATNWFDGVCSHPYSSTAAGCLSVNRTLLLRGLLYGAPKEAWITEVGFQSGWKDGPGLVADEAQKAEQGALALRGLAEQSQLVTWYSGNEKGNMYGLNRIEANGALRPMPIFYEMGAITGRLPKAGGPVVIRVEGPGKAAPGAALTLRLCASNASRVAQPVKLWPVGFLDALGPAHAEISALDCDAVLAPGQTRFIEVRLVPDAKAKGIYPVGLVAIGAKENSLGLVDLEIAP